MNGIAFNSQPKAYYPVSRRCPPAPARLGIIVFRTRTPPAYFEFEYEYRFTEYKYDCNAARCTNYRVFASRAVPTVWDSTTGLAPVVDEPTTKGVNPVWHYVALLEAAYFLGMFALFGIGAI